MNPEMAAASRRMKVVATHFSPAASADEPCSTAASAACLLQVNCSSNVLLNSVLPPRRNRIYFARQSSSSQSFFMRQQQQAPSAPPQQEGAPRCSTSGDELLSGAPLFSRPANTSADPRGEAASNDRIFVQQHSSRIYQLPDFSRACYSSPVPNILPKFAQPAISVPGRCTEKSARSENQLVAPNIPPKRSSRPNGIGWSPRMNVHECAGYFLVAVEIPGGDAGDMRVEVDEHNLRITGKRSAMALPPAAAANVSVSSTTYHRREIPYQIMWPLPCRINKDSIAAEFMNGLLLINIPKL